MVDNPLIPAMHLMSNCVWDRKKPKNYTRVLEQQFPTPAPRRRSATAAPACPVWPCAAAPTLRRAAPPECHNHRHYYSTPFSAFVPILVYLVLYDGNTLLASQETA